MNTEIQNKLNLFVENTQNINRGFKWHSALIKRLTATLYTQKNRIVNSDDIKRCHGFMKKNVNSFSMFRGTLELCIAALLSLSDNPEYLFENTLNVYNMLKKQKFYASDYLVMAAYQIAADSEPIHYQRFVERTREFYDNMKSHHWYYTGEDDYIFAAMLALSDLSVDIASERIELLYSKLKKEFSSGNSIQSLSHTLVLGGKSDTIVNRIVTLRDKLKSRRLRLDYSYTILSLGVLALLPVDIDVIVNDLTDARDFLRTQKGFKSFSINTQELLLFASAIIGSEYSVDLNDDILTTALSTSINNIIIAQQTAAIAAIAFTSVAHTIS